MLDQPNLRMSTSPLLISKLSFQVKTFLSVELHFCCKGLSAVELSLLYDNGDDEDVFENNIFILIHS